jgi:nicotinamidase/pyrazinamidase
VKSALIVVDIQNDFLPDGALAVREGDQVVPVIRGLMDSGRYDLIIATQDWHPRNHCGFADNQAGKQVGDVIELAGLPQVLWPVHCVQHSYGAEIAPELDTTQFDRIIQKGTDPSIDSYSGFFDNGHSESTGLGEWLRGDGVTDIYIAGLATDYCVKFTALDGVKLKFNVHVIPAACRGVELRPGDMAAAIEEMTAAGVKLEDV